MKKNWWKLAIVLLLVVVVAVVMAGKNKSPDDEISADSTVTMPVDEQVGEDDSLAQEETVTAEADPKVQPTVPADEGESVPLEKPVQKDVTATNVQPAPTASKPDVKPKSEAKPGKTQLPKMIELGADKCVPCKMMRPIMAELEKEYAGKLVIEYIDVWEDKAKADQYNVRFIPTQVFLDENGKEFFRHTGFFSKEDILKTFRDHGIDL